jgi:hypothetical protein
MQLEAVILNLFLTEVEAQNQIISDSRWTSEILKLFFYAYLQKLLPVVFFGCETWSPILGEKQTEGIGEQGSEENIRTEEAWNNEERHNLQYN